MRPQEQTWFSRTHELLYNRSHYKVKYDISASSQSKDNVTQSPALMRFMYPCVGLQCPSQENQMFEHLAEKLRFCHYCEIMREKIATQGSLKQDLTLQMIMMLFYDQVALRINKCNILNNNQQPRSRFSHVPTLM